MGSDILLCFLGCGIARFLSLQPASRSVRVASRSHRGLPRGPREQTLRPKWSILGVFLALPTKTSFTTSQNYPKYEVWEIEILCGRIPLRLSQSPYPLTVKYLQGFYRNGDLLNVLNATFGSLAMQQIALICILKIWSSLL